MALSLRQEILLDKLQSDLHIEKARLKDQQDRRFMTIAGPVSEIKPLYETNAVIEEIQCQIDLLIKQSETKTKSISPENYLVIVGNSLKDLFVPYDISELLKQLHFDSPVKAFYYVGNNNVITTNKFERYNATSDRISCPDYYQLFMWIKNKYDIYVDLNSVNFLINKEELKINLYPIFKQALNNIKDE